MIPKEIEKLVIEVATLFEGKRGRAEATKEPEIILVAMLRRIKERRDEPSAMLGSTIESSFFEDNQEEARQLLKRGYKKR